MSLRPVFLLLVGVGVVWLERRRPLRSRRERSLPHTGRNLAVAGLSAAAVHLIEAPVVLPLASWTARRRWGLLHLAPTPAWLRDVLAVALLDYTLYCWHIVTHRVPALWRVHLVHHVDRDLDASTGLRFHFAEIASSVPWRAAQVALIGVSPRALTWWQTLTLASILFHHSNARLPLRLERVLSRVVVTPRMHGIHHSMNGEEANGNYSSGLALWDWLHGTIRLNVPQQTIEIGVPSYRAAHEVTLGPILVLPITHDRESWKFEDGTAPPIYQWGVPRQHLLA